MSTVAAARRRYPGSPETCRSDPVAETVGDCGRRGSSIPLAGEREGGSSPPARRARKLSMSSERRAVADEMRQARHAPFFFSRHPLERSRVRAEGLGVAAVNAVARNSERF